jgi:hypothetical protein
MNNDANKLNKVVPANDLRSLNRLGDGKRERNDLSFDVCVSERQAARENSIP